LRTNEAKPGLGYCCPAVRTHYPHASATVTLCPATTQPHIVLLHFFRSLSADGKEKRIILKDIICWLGKTKAGKGLQENRAGSMASRAEGFFAPPLKLWRHAACLIFLFLFVSRQKESHSGSG